MRILVVLLSTLLAFAGCLDGGADDGTEGDGTGGDGTGSDGNGGDGTGSDGTGSDGTPPDPLRFEGMLVGVAGALDCEVEVNCAEHAFSVDDTWKAELVLAGNTATADYDLYLFNAGGTQLGSSINPAGQEDKVTTVLAPGDYTARVHAWDDVATGYVLDITFSAA